MRTPTPEIREAFYRRLLESLPIGQVTASDIAWPNSNFRADPERYYLAPAIMYAQTETVTLSPKGYEKLHGIFQINICGLPNQGEGELDYMARKLTDIFRAGTRIELCGWWPVTITRAYRSQLRFGGHDRPEITVSANWEQFTPKGE